MAKDINNITEKDTTIYSDWFIVKQKIWDNWFNLITYSAELIIFKIKDFNPKQSRLYAKTCGALYKVYRSIGLRYKTFLSDDEFTQIKSIAEKVQEGKKINLSDIQSFLDLTESWLQKSGMGKIDRAVDDPAEAILEGAR